MDRIRQSLDNNNFVFWEEIARDGAQGKTILSGTQRAEIAIKQSEIFGKHAPDHLVYAAGFSAIGQDEILAIEEVAEKVDTCNIAVNCRTIRKEIDLTISAVKKAKFPRVAFVMPTSARLCDLMLHKTQEEALAFGLDIAKYALDKAGGIPVDVQLAGSFDADPIFIAKAARLFEACGISVVHLGDTRGGCYPKEIGRYFDKLIENSSNNLHYGVHLHNDLGFALVNNFAALTRGIKLCATSWLGIAERNGLVQTEMLLTHLAYEPEKLKARLNIDGEHFFKSLPNLKLQHPLVHKVSEYTEVPIKVTDPIIGKGVNTISTGTPFVDRKSFEAFDPEEVLGIPRKVFVTQLASRRIIIEKCKELGYTLTDEQIISVLKIVKNEAYSTGVAIIPEKRLHEIFSTI